MNKFVSIFPLAVLVAQAYCVESKADVISTTLSPSSIQQLYINTTSNTAAANYAILQSPAGTFQGGCLGLFINAETNKATYSMLLSAVLAQKSIVVAYDPSISSPWGNAAWCALIYAAISP